MILRKPIKKDYEKMYPMIIDESIIKYVRFKPVSIEHYLFIMNEYIRMEDNGEAIIRTIVVNNEPIGAISLFDIKNEEGFLATWIGTEFQGKGYNQQAKELFFKECFDKYSIKNIFMKIRTENIKSQKAATKIEYIEKACPVEYQTVYKEVNLTEYIFDIFFVNKRKFLELIYQNDEECFLDRLESILNPLLNFNDESEEGQLIPEIK